MAVLGPRDKEGMEVSAFIRSEDSRALIIGGQELIREQSLGRHQPQRHIDRQLLRSEKTRAQSPS